jgi:hypothetical protein
LEFVVFSDTLPVGFGADAVGAHQLGIDREGAGLTIFCDSAAKEDE